MALKRQNARPAPPTCFTVGGHMERLRSVLRSGDCFSLKALAVSGDELLKLGFSGTELGKALSQILDYVIEHPSGNRKELLLALAKEIKRN